MNRQLIIFIRLLVTFLFLIVVVQAAVTNSSKGQNANALTLSKQASLYDDYDLNDHKTLGTNGEGSGGAASLDEYADDDEDEQLSKVTATTVSSSTSTTTRVTTTITSTTTTFSKLHKNRCFHSKKINSRLNIENLFRL